MHWRRKWQPTPAFLPGESQGLGSLVGCRLWGRTESVTTEATAVAAAAAAACVCLIGDIKKLHLCNNNFMSSTGNNLVMIFQLRVLNILNTLGCCCCKVASVESDFVRPHRWQPTRLPRPWDSPGKNTGVGCHFLLQCMKVKSESEVAQSCRTLSDPMDCSLPGSSVHGIFQARVLEWGAIAFSTKAA